MYEEDFISIYKSLRYTYIYLHTYIYTYIYTHIYTHICLTRSRTYYLHLWTYIQIILWLSSAKLGHLAISLFINVWRRSELDLHSIMKWNSSSTFWQVWHSRSLTGVIGLVYRPLSISRAWELTRSLDIATRYLISLTLLRQGSVPNLVLRTLYVRNIGFDVAFWIDMRHSLINAPWFHTCKRL